MTDEYATLRAAHAAGATIIGVEHDGRMHIITDPEWSCPPSRYLAVVPYALSEIDAATIARVRALADEYEEQGRDVTAKKLRAALEGSE